MAISPKKLLELSREEKAEVDNLESIIDKALIENYHPGASFRYEINQKLRKAQCFVLEKRYQKAGWLVSGEGHGGDKYLLILRDESD